MADGVTISDWLIVGSTLVSPLLAVQAQKWIERARERTNRKQAIFETLMTTRGARLQPEHVRALNQIDLEFSGNGVGRIQTQQSTKDRTVVNAWKDYADVLNEDTDKMQETQFQLWVQRSEEKFIALLHAMSAALGYDFNAVELRRGAYHPKAYWLAERRQQVLQDALGRVLHGDLEHFPI